MTERNFLVAECRAHADRLELTGVVVRFGDEAEIGRSGGKAVRERFEAGAFGDVRSSDVILHWQHDRDRPLARTGGGGLTLRASPEAVTMEARLDPALSYAADIVQLVRNRIVRSLSVEFQPLRVRWDGATRVVEKARLVGIGVVSQGAYPESSVAARQELEAAPAASKLPGHWWTFG